MRPPLALLLVMAAAASAWSAPARAADCDARAMDALRAAAQAQADSTPALAESMMSCPAKDEVQLWLSFYYRSRGEYDKSAKVGSGGAVAGKSGRDAVFSRAENGDFAELEQRVTRGEAGYGGDAEAALILARALIRAGRFEDGRRYYERYLELKGDDTDVRIEEAYSFVWEEVYEEAQRRFEELLRQSLTPGQEDSAKRGLALVKRKRDIVEHRAVESDAAAEGVDAGTGAESRAREPISVSAGTEYFTSSDAFDRASLLMRVETGIVNLGGAVDSLNSNYFSQAPYTTAFAALPNEAQTAFEGYVSKYLQVGAGTTIGGKLGIYSTDSVRAEFEFRVDPMLDGNWRPSLGVYQIPLARDLPLPPFGLGWLRQGAFGGIAYQDYIEYRIDAFDTTDWGGGVKNFLRARFGLDRSRAPAEHLDLLIQAEDEAYNEWNPYFYSPVNVLVVSAGLDYKKNFSNQFRLTAMALGGYASDTEFAAESQFYPPASGSNTTVGLLRYEIEAEAEYDLRKNLTVIASGRLVGSNNDADISYYNSKQIGLSLKWVVN